LGLSAGIDFLPVVGMPTEPLPTSGTFVVTMDILSVGAVNLQTSVNVAYWS
jgi:hypothetical protein